MYNIAVYFYEFCSILTSQNTKNELFSIQLLLKKESYKDTLKCRLVLKKESYKETLKCRQLN